MATVPRYERKIKPAVVGGVQAPLSMGISPLQKVNPEAMTRETEAKANAAGLGAKAAEMGARGPAAMIQAIEQFKGITDRLTGSAAKFFEVQAESNLNAAKIEAMKSFDEIQNNLRQVDDQDEFDKTYKDQTTEVFNNLSQRLGGRTYDDFNFWYQQMALQGYSAGRQTVFKNTADKYMGNLMVLGQATVAKYGEPLTAEQDEIVTKTFEDAVFNGMDMGAIDKTQGTKIIMGMRADKENIYFNKLVADNPAEALKQLDANEFKYQTPERLVAMRNTAEAARDDNRVDVAVQWAIAMSGGDQEKALELLASDEGAKEIADVRVRAQAINSLGAAVNTMRFQKEEKRRQDFDQSVVGIHKALKAGNAQAAKDALEAAQRSGIITGNNYVNLDNDIAGMNSKTSDAAWADITARLHQGKPLSLEDALGMGLKADKVEDFLGKAEKAGSVKTASNYFNMSTDMFKTWAGRDEDRKAMETDFKEYLNWVMDNISSKATGKNITPNDPELLEWARKWATEVVTDKGFIYDFSRIASGRLRWLKGLGNTKKTLGEVFMEQRPYLNEFGISPEWNNALEQISQQKQEKMGEKMTMTVPVQQAISAASAQTGVDEGLLKAVAWVESGFDHYGSTSPAGAQGLMQLMPGTAKDLGVDASDLNQNAMGGATYLKRMLQRYDGDPVAALVAYNWGPGNFEDAGKPLDPAKWPLETRNYVRKVMAYAEAFGPGQESATPTTGGQVSVAEAAGIPDSAIQDIGAQIARTYGTTPTIDQVKRVWDANPDMHKKYMTVQ